MKMLLLIDRENYTGNDTVCGIYPDTAENRELARNWAIGSLADNALVYVCEAGKVLNVDSFELIEKW